MARRRADEGVPDVALCMEGGDACNAVGDGQEAEAADRPSDPQIPGLPATLFPDIGLPSPGLPMAKKSASRKPARTTGRSRKAPSKAPARRAKPQAKGAANTIGGRPMNTLTGQLVVDGAAKAIEWYGLAFGAKELDRRPMPDGRIMHAVLLMGNSAFMISDSFGPAPKELSGAFLHIQDKGIDKMWERAIAHGASPILPLANQFWGDRYGQLRDPFGQTWSLGWPAKMTAQEKTRLQQEAMATMAGRAPS